MNTAEALIIAVARIEDLLKNDDPQAWKEAERVLPQLREAVAKAAPAAPQGMRLAPIWLLERVEQSLGSFTSDEGWSQADMDTMDSVSALLAATTAAPSQPAVPMSESQRADMICAVAAICTGTSSRTVAANAIEWVERYYGITAPSQPAVPQWITADESPLMALSDCINLLESPKQLNDSVRVWACVQNAKAAMKLLAATPSAPSQPVALTDEEIDKVVLEATGYDGFGTQPMNSHDLRNVVHDAIAAMHEKQGGV